MWNIEKDWDEKSMREEEEKMGLVRVGGRWEWKRRIGRKRKR